MPYKDNEKRRAHNKKYYQEHKEERIAYGKKYRQKHKERLKNSRKKYHQEHKEERKAYGRKYRQEHKEEIKERRREYYKKYYQQNKEKYLNQSREWCEENPLKKKHRRRKNHLAATYGLSLQEYDDLYNQQQGCCAICNRHRMELKRVLFVDHDHKTKKVRGLLCYSCNTGLALYESHKKKILNYLGENK